MRTTLTIDDDVLAAARGLAARRRMTLGEVISELSRQALRPSSASPLEAVRNGIRLLPLRADATPVTLELVNGLRDELA
ncbi:hypothetical protein BH11PSE8_BH11PSE8_35640 [soil metagenome]